MIAETGYLQDIDFDNFNYQRMIDHIDNLPDGCRTVFCMYVLDDLAHGEIAELLGIRESSSRSQLFKARKLLQELINQDQLLLTELKHIK